MTTATHPLATKFRTMAERLQRDIDAKRGDRRQNTPKQQREAMSAAIDANHLERAQRAMFLLADCHENGGPPPELSGVKSKAEILDYLRTRIDTSGGYYSVRDTGEYSNTTPIGVALQKFLAGEASAQDRARDEERQQREKINAMEARVKFLDIPGFFPTPREIIDLMLDHAQIQPGHMVLEPSAGKGDIADAIAERYNVCDCQLDLQPEEIRLTCIEVNHTLAGICTAKGHDCIRNDFLETSDGGGSPFWDRVVMNPPFERGQDVDHVRHAYAALKPGGRLVAIMSAGTFFRTDRKSQEFRDWMAGLNHESSKLPDDAFKSAFRSTGVSTWLVVIEK